MFLHLVRFNGNSKRDFLTYILKCVFNFTVYDGTTINNEAKKEFYVRKNAKT